MDRLAYSILLGLAELPHLDAEHANTIFSIAQSTGSETFHSRLMNFMENPEVDPWDIPGIYSERTRSGLKP